VKRLVVLMAVATASYAVAAPARGETITLRCKLRNTPPRAGHVHDTFIQHVRIDLAADTVDGRRATITDKQIGWEPREVPRPYATLSRPGWHYHSAGQYGTVSYYVNGTCVEMK
jgi:hypothetical protein